MLDSERKKICDGTKKKSLLFFLITTYAHARLLLIESCLSECD